MNKYAKIRYISTYYIYAYGGLTRDELFYLSEQELDDCHDY